MSSPERFGLDKEIAAKLAAKCDDAYVRAACEWVERVVGDDSVRVGTTLDDVYTSLRSGVVLCRLADALVPGCCAGFCAAPTHALEERGNLQRYLAACAGPLGVLSQELFEVGDLHSRRSLPSVVVHLYGLGRAAQQLPTFTGPVLGPRYTVTREEQEAREQRRADERAAAAARDEAERERAAARRAELEREKSEKLERAATVEDALAEERRAARARRKRKNTAAAKTPATARRKRELSPVKYGMDREHEAKMAAKLDEQTRADQRRILDWLEELTDYPLDYFWEALRSGRVLCTALNKVLPRLVAKFTDRDEMPALMERENIQLYLNGCLVLGLERGQLFSVSDLHERKDLTAVVNNLLALGEQVHYVREFKGPYMPGTSGKKVSRQATERTALLSGAQRSDMYPGDDDDARCCACCSVM